MISPACSVEDGVCVSRISDAVCFAVAVAVTRTTLHNTSQPQAHSLPCDRISWACGCANISHY